MNLSSPELNINERRAAHELWQALMFAPSMLRLEEAREQLRQASPAVHQAVINAIAGVWRQGRDPLPDENPFAPLA